MDKYEYKLKVEQIRKLNSRKEFYSAMQIADSMDFRREKDVKVLTMVSEVYAENGKYDDAIELLLQAYELAPIGKRIIYRLTELALDAGHVKEAESYFKEFRHIAPSDQGLMILRYKIDRAKGVPIRNLIKILEDYKQIDFDERWAFELATLYDEAGRGDDCVKLCDEIILWFALGKYVEKAMALKIKYAPLTDSQKEKIENKAKYEAQLEEVQREYGSMVERKESKASEEVLAEEADELEEAEQEAEQASEAENEANTTAEAIEATDAEVSDENEAPETVEADTELTKDDAEDAPLEDEEAMETEKMPETPRERIVMRGGSAFGQRPTFVMPSVIKESEAEAEEVKELQVEEIFEEESPEDVELETATEEEIASEIEVEPDAEPESETELETEFETEPEVLRTEEPESEPEQLEETEAELEAETTAEEATEIEAETETEKEAEIEVAPEAEEAIKAEAEAEEATEAVLEAEVETEAEPLTEVPSETEAEAKATPTKPSWMDSDEELTEEEIDRILKEMEERERILEEGADTTLKQNEIHLDGMTVTAEVLPGSVTTPEGEVFETETEEEKSEAIISSGMKVVLDPEQVLAERVERKTKVLMGVDVLGTLAESLIWEATEFNDIDEEEGLTPIEEILINLEEEELERQRIAEEEARKAAELEAQLQQELAEKIRIQQIEMEEKQRQEEEAKRQQEILDAKERFELVPPEEQLYDIVASTAMSNAKKMRALTGLINDLILVGALEQTLTNIQNGYHPDDDDQKLNQENPILRTVRLDDLEGFLKDGGSIPEPPLPQIEEPKEDEIETSNEIVIETATEAEEEAEALEATAETAEEAVATVETDEPLDEAFAQEEEALEESEEALEEPEECYDKTIELPRLEHYEEWTDEDETVENIESEAEEESEVDTEPATEAEAEADEVATEEIAEEVAEEIAEETEVEAETEPKAEAEEAEEVEEEATESEEARITPPILTDMPYDYIVPGVTLATAGVAAATGAKALEAELTEEAVEEAAEIAEETAEETAEDVVEGALEGALEEAVETATQTNVVPEARVSTGFTVELPELDIADDRNDVTDEELAALAAELDSLDQEPEEPIDTSEMEDSILAGLAASLNQMGIGVEVPKTETAVVVEAETEPVEAEAEQEALAEELLEAEAESKIGVIDESELNEDDEQYWIDTTGMEQESMYTIPSAEEMIRQAQEEQKIAQAINQEETMEESWQEAEALVPEETVDEAEELAEELAEESAEEPAEETAKEPAEELPVEPEHDEQPNQEEALKAEVEAETETEAQEAAEASEKQETEAKVSTKDAETEEKVGFFSRKNKAKKKAEEAVAESKQTATEIHFEHVYVKSEKPEAGYRFALDYLKKLPESQRPASVAKTNGLKLATRGIAASVEKLRNRVVIVEQAGQLSEDALSDLYIFLVEKQEQCMLVLIDNPLAIDKLKKKNEAMASLVTKELTYVEFSADELVLHAKKYAEEQDCVLDEMGTLALYALIEQIIQIKDGSLITEVEDIMDEAIEEAEKISVGNLVQGIFGSKYNKEGQLILKEKHFNKISVD